MGLRKKTGAKKSRETVPLRSLEAYFEVGTGTVSTGRYGTYLPTYVDTGTYGVLCCIF